MNNLLFSVYFANALLCVLFGFRMLSTATRSSSGVLLGVNYILYASQYALGIFALALHWEIAGQLRAFGATLIGPFIYIYYRNVTQGKYAQSWLDVVHFILPMVCLALIIEPSRWSFFVDQLIIISFGIYLALATLQIYKGWRAPQGDLRPSAHAFYWLSVLTILLAVNLMIEVMVYVEIQSGTPLEKLTSALYGALLFLVANTVTIFLAMSRSPLLEWMDRIGEERSQKTSSVVLNDVQAQELYSRWNRMVVDHKLFQLDGGIDIKTAARKLCVPVRHLSEAINRRYGGSFSQHLNDFRVQYAATLLKTHPDTSISDILLEAGFSTKSNFNKEFLRVMKMSPSAYRKKCDFG